jgi:Fe-S-cluster containining protein
MPTGSKPVSGSKKTDLKQCDDCPALCCHDLSIEIKRPRTRHEIDDLKWRLNYDTVGIYLRNRRWHMVVKGRCQFLDEANLCTIYDRRYDICRDHTPPYCEKYDDWYDVMFTHPDELEAYLRAQRRGEKVPMPKNEWASKGAGPGGKRRPRH